MFQEIHTISHICTHAGQSRLKWDAMVPCLGSNQHTTWSSCDVTGFQGGKTLHQMNPLAEPNMYLKKMDGLKIS